MFVLYNFPMVAWSKKELLEYIIRRKSFDNKGNLSAFRCCKTLRSPRKGTKKDTPQTIFVESTSKPLVPRNILAINESI